jgi:hypothetical protein
MLALTSHDAGRWETEVPAVTTVLHRRGAGHDRESARADRAWDAFWRRAPSGTYEPGAVNRRAAAATPSSQPLNRLVCPTSW